jgi:hypothetical protein
MERNKRELAGNRRKVRREDEEGRWRWRGERKCKVGERGRWMERWEGRRRWEREVEGRKRKEDEGEGRGERGVEGGRGKE